MYTEIEYEQRGHVGIITIDRPEARNALTFTTYAELADAVDTTTARCLVITGRDPAFCSGDDVKQVMVAASSDPMMLNALSWSVLESGKAKGPVLEMAMDAAKKANELSGGKDGSILDTLARAYWESGDAKKAISLQEQAIAVAPEGRMKESMKTTLEQYRNGKLSG